MNQDEQIRALEGTGRTIIGLFDEIPVVACRWKPSPDAWSLLEILGHLVDEERDDFRTRLSLTLEDPTAEWPPIDPEGWARSRDYNSRDLGSSLAAFETERAASLEWLRSLSAPNWANERRHPKIGGIRAGDLLVSWLAHDLRHIRQIANTRLTFLAEHARPFSTRYAGP